MLDLKPLFVSSGLMPSPVDKAVCYVVVPVTSSVPNNFHPNFFNTTCRENDDNTTTAIIVSVFPVFVQPDDNDLVPS